MEKEGNGKRRKWKKKEMENHLVGRHLFQAVPTVLLSPACRHSDLHSNEILTSFLDNFFMPPFFKYLWCRLSKSFLEAHLDAGHPGTHPAAQGVREGKDGQGSMGLKKNMYKKM